MPTRRLGDQIALLAVPFVVIGTIFAWTGLAIAKLGYVIGGGPYKGFDPLGLFDDSRKYE